jgi:hypothetical protein
MHIAKERAKEREATTEMQRAATAGALGERASRRRSLDPGQTGTAAHTLVGAAVDAPRRGRAWRCA